MLAANHKQFAPELWQAQNTLLEHTQYILHTDT